MRVGPPSLLRGRVLRRDFVQHLLGYLKRAVRRGDAGVDRGVEQHLGDLGRLHAVAERRRARAARSRARGRAR